MSSRSWFLVPEAGNGAGDAYYREIDLIKAVAVIAVVVLHSLPVDTLKTLLAPFHVWQAVPVFMMVAGMNSYFSAARLPAGWRAHYAARRWRRYGRRLLAPFTVVWLLEVAVLLATRRPPAGKIFFSYFSGGFGPGSYFIPIFVQHLLFYPLIFRWLRRFRDKQSLLLLLVFFGAALLLEYLCVAANLPEKVYRLLYVRYFFAVAVGSLLVSRPLSRPLFRLLAFLAICYVWGTVYGRLRLPFIYPAWGFQHAPAYFYTALLVAGCWRGYGRWRRPAGWLLPVGRASFHVFLVQMLWFWLWGRHLRPLLGSDVVYLLVNLAVILPLGGGFYALHRFVDRRLSPGGGQPRPRPA